MSIAQNPVWSAGGKGKNRMVNLYRAKRAARALRVQSVDEFLRDKSNRNFGAHIPTQADGYEVGAL